MDLFSAIVTLLLIMDPLGNIPLFLSVLKKVAPQRRRTVLVREIVLAYVVLLVFLLLGKYLMRFLSLEQESVSIAGGIVLFLIAIKMIFPVDSGVGDSMDGEPFLVPLAVPLIAGPSTLAALLLLQQSADNDTLSLFFAVTVAWLISGVVLLSSTFFYRILGERGLAAMERLMGMLLVMVAVQMLLSGVRTFLAR